MQLHVCARTIATASAIFRLQTWTWPRAENEPWGIYTRRCSIHVTPPLHTRLCISSGNARFVTHSSIVLLPVSCFSSPFPRYVVSLIVREIAQPFDVPVSLNENDFFSPLFVSLAPSPPPSFWIIKSEWNLIRLFSVEKRKVKFTTYLSNY